MNDLRGSRAGAGALAALLAALLLAGLFAGFFYTWSFTVMNGLDEADPAAAIGAMQAVNANIRNVWFAAVFFGAPMAALVATWLLAATGRRGAAFLAGLGFLALAGTVIVTMVQHVPWNEALAAETGPWDADRAAAVWADYAGKWTAWNHLRATLGLAGFALLAAALAVTVATGPRRAARL